MGACEECGFDADSLSPADTTTSLRAFARRYRAPLTRFLPGEDGDTVIRQRADPSTWSALEYACHVRDVYSVYTIRLHRTRVEEGPVLEPMLNDLRAVRFSYNRREIGAVLAELEDNVAGFIAETARFAAPDWDRVATRLPGEERTARWLVRQAMHEGTHHLRDVAAVIARVDGKQGP